MPEAGPVQPLSYAQNVPASTSRLWASAILSMTGLGMIALGGCFLIGVLILFYPAIVFGASGPVATTPWSWGTYAFATALSVLSLICFFFAAWLLVVTVRRTLRMLLD
jgi:hypothetical protein